MDNEVSNSVHITISLIVMSVIIGMLALFTVMSQSFGRQATASIVDTQAETYATELINTANYGAVPAASVYVMLQKNASAIHSFSGSINTIPITKVDDLTRFFHIKVRLTLTKISDMYDVVIKEE
ncbi:hypothetical protein EHS13_29895 [Paenibacillus psychroresistens]|uniref:Uncharacterized protein n=1 Tax=Paenibacillus psychroresistens TaxID=1778678 RepID=A0A6B8RS63_9BACL|nr:hypothetical protein [Paenibacillus psychroresistens]QGQ98789.1 hypothetical protein EHS13_29895 [Paenibacillus psychroresistens]